MKSQFDGNHKIHKWLTLNGLGGGRGVKDMHSTVHVVLTGPFCLKVANKSELWLRRRENFGSENYSGFQIHSLTYWNRSKFNKKVDKLSGNTSTVCNAALWRNLSPLLTMSIVERLERAASFFWFNFFCRYIDSSVYFFFFETFKAMLL